MFLKEFTGYKWPIALENVHADHLTTEDSRLRIVKALELVLPQPFNRYDQGYVTEAHKGLFSFGSEVAASKKLLVSVLRTCLTYLLTRR